MTRFLLAVASGALLVALMASTVLAGEVTGNGKNLQIDGGKWGTNLHARSVCAFSGQEDLQYFTNQEGNTGPHPITRGVPGHAQSWGQIPKAVRDTFGGNPGTFCNPVKGG